MEMDSSPSPTPTHQRRPCSDLTLTLTPPDPVSSDLQSLKPEERGIRLIHLLLTCAGHAAASNLPCANACLLLISALSSPTGDSMQRLSSRLASSISSRLLRLRFPGLLSCLYTQWAPPSPSKWAHLAFARALPYLPFAYSVAMRTLLHTLNQERLVHVIDLKASHSSIDLWVPLLRSFAQLPSGPPHLKLTAVSPNPQILDSLGSSLIKEADSLYIPFQFNPINSSLTKINPDSLRVKTGEAVVVVSVLALHELLAEPNDEGKRIEGFLSAVRGMSPKVMLIMEHESDHNSGKMAERFVEAMHYYSTVYDSVEAMGLGEEERVGVEDVVGWEVENVVGREGVERVERHERAERWAGTMGRAGFRQARVGWDAAEEGRRVVERWQGEGGGGGGGYGVVVDRGCLMICWHDRPLYAVSVWHC